MAQLLEQTLRTMELCGIIKAYKAEIADLERKVREYQRELQSLNDNSKPITCEYEGQTLYVPSDEAI